MLSCFWGWCVQDVDRRTVSDPCSSGHYSYVRQTTPLLIRILHFFHFFHSFSSFHSSFIIVCKAAASLTLIRFLISPCRESVTWAREKGTSNFPPTRPGTERFLAFTVSCLIYLKDNGAPAYRNVVAPYPELGLQGYNQH